MMRNKSVLKSPVFISVLLFALVSLTTGQAFGQTNGDPVVDAEAFLKNADYKDMVIVPAGEFIRGSDDRHKDEMPRHTSAVESSYAIDKYEVSNKKFKTFIDVVGISPSRYWPDGVYPEDKGNYPVRFVTWNVANAYCAYEGKRLPSDQEWEKAARGTEGQDYPWGNEFDARKANTPYSGIDHTVPVGSYPEGRSPYGLYDVSGNVWEWVDSWAVPHPGSPTPNAHYFNGLYKVTKGGSYADCTFYKCGISALTFNRGFFEPKTAIKSIGLRCAKDLPKTPAEK